MDFKKFKTAVAKQFKEMQEHPLFTVDVDKDELWVTYLNSFPPGSNPMFRERTEHDCSCCKQFLRAVGGLIALVDGKVISIWDVDAGDPNYQAVADALAALVKSKSIDNAFLTTERVAGHDKNFEQMVDHVQTWEHFFINIPDKFVVPQASIGTKIGELRADHDVLLRSMQEIRLDAISTVLDLIAQNSLYRGEEHSNTLHQFHALLVSSKGYPASLGTLAWELASTVPPAVRRIRNTSIGTLLVDLSSGLELEDAVKKFEAMVAPANYKRPTALVTKAMVEKAKVQVHELGLTSALERRYARLTDITVNNVLFADRSAKKAMGGDVFDEIGATAGVKSKSFDKVEEVSIDKFLSDILPTANSIEVLVENRHVPNLVSLIAPVDPTAGKLFKWDNGFSWSYNRDVADSDLRREVQARGGRVDGVFRFSHQWNYGKRNASLMDLHVFMPGSQIEPTNGANDLYGNYERVGWNNRTHPRSGGVQDVDYTSEAPTGYIPVENITFPDLARMPDGRYICKIHNWRLRAPTQGGFKAEIEFGGEVFQYEYDKPLADKEWVTVAEVTLKGGVFSIKHHLPESTSSKQVWNVSTQNFHRVSAVMLSPNHWDGHGVGNKHYFFMLDGCKNDGTARGFYNEFLKSEMDQHRKVLEIVGAKMRTEETDDQMSGLGFSSTQRNKLTVRVKGSFTRVINVVF